VKRRGLATIARNRHKYPKRETNVVAHCNPTEIRNDAEHGMPDLLSHERRAMPGKDDQNKAGGELVGNLSPNRRSVKAEHHSECVVSLSEGTRVN
jgi:hypothetical protein